MAQDHLARTANVKWTGDVAHGRGDITTESGKVSASYSYGTRFSGAKQAEASCPISNALRAVPSITVSATLTT